MHQSDIIVKIYKAVDQINQNIFIQYFSMSSATKPTEKSQKVPEPEIQVSPMQLRSKKRATEGLSKSHADEDPAANVSGHLKSAPQGSKMTKKSAEEKNSKQQSKRSDKSYKSKVIEEKKQEELKSKSKKLQVESVGSKKMDQDISLGHLVPKEELQETAIELQQQADLSELPEQKKSKSKSKSVKQSKKSQRQSNKKAESSSNDFELKDSPKEEKPVDENLSKLSQKNSKARTAKSSKKRDASDHSNASLSRESKHTALRSKDSKKGLKSVTGSKKIKWQN